MKRLWRWMQNPSSSKPARTAGQTAKHRARRLTLESLDARRVLASAYQNPGQVFDVNNDTYVDQEDIRLCEERLASWNNGFLPATRNHELIPYYDVNGDGSLTKQDIADLRRQIEQGPATTSFKLVNDSGNKLDRTTNDVRITGRIMNFDAQTRVFAWFGGGQWTQVDVTNLIARDGTFQFSIHDLHRINGRLFADGDQTMFMQSYNRQGRTSGVVDYAFTIDRKGPGAFTLNPANITEPQVGRPATWEMSWTQNDARSYDLRVTTDAAGKNTVQLQHDLYEIHGNRSYIRDLPAGTYYVWVTGFDRSGNRTVAIGSGQRVEWTKLAVIPAVNPAIFKTVAIDGVPTDTWKAAWSHFAQFVNGYKFTVSRDQAGTDIVLQRDLNSDQTEFDLTHLAKGDYYVSIVEKRFPNQEVTICDAALVQWKPSRPDDFSLTEPGFVIGNTLDLQWEAAQDAVGYQVRLYKTDSPKASWAGINVYPNNFPRNQWSQVYTYAYNTHVGDFDTTTNHFHFDNLEDGQYVFEIVAISAKGTQTLSRNIAEFTVDADGQIDGVNNYVYKSIGRTDANFILNVPATLSAMESIRIEIYTSPDLSPASLLEKHDVTDSSGISKPLAPYLAYPKLYVKVTYFDYKGVSISLPDPIEIDTANLYYFPPPITMS